VQLTSLELQYSRVEQEGHEGNCISLKLESEILQRQTAQALEDAKCTQYFTWYHMLEELLDDIGEWFQSQLCNPLSTEV
jgi:hypothetical protein